MKIEGFVDVDSVDYILMNAQMNDDTFISFENGDDLYPELVRIVLDCGKVVESMDSLDRFIDKYPDYEFSWHFLNLISNVRPTRRFVEHVLRTTPDNVSMLLNNHGIVVVCGFGVVDRIWEIHPDRDRFGKDELQYVSLSDKKNIVSGMMIQGQHHYIKEIMSNPKVDHEEKMMLAEWVRMSTYNDKADLPEFLDQLGF